jgi:phosphinothricin acetyltransferase
MDAKLNGPLHAEAATQEAGLRVLVRNSRDGDVPGMLAIYLHHIRRGVDPGVDGEFEAPDAEDIKRRRRSMNNRKMPHLVAEEAGTVVGYAVVPFRQRPACRYAASIWCAATGCMQGSGVLLTALIDACCEGFANDWLYRQAPASPRSSCMKVRLPPSRIPAPSG